MRALAALLMRRRTNAMTAAAVCGALSLLMPPLTYVSGAIVALSTLKQGLREGALVVAGAVALSALFSLIVVGSVAPAFAFLLMSWAPMWVVAAALFTWRGQGAALVAATVLGIVAVTALHIAVSDPAEWWRSAMAEVFRPMLEAQAGATQTDVARMLSQALDDWAPRMTRFFGAATVIGLTVTLCLARWWHASLDNPGGFGREFRALAVPRAMIVLTLVVGVGSLFAPALRASWVGDLMGPLTAMLAFQGLAVAHAVVKARGASAGWLVALYVTVLVPPHLALPLLILTGLVDGWINLRARAGASNKGT